MLGTGAENSAAAVKAGEVPSGRTVIEHQNPKSRQKWKMAVGECEKSVM